MKKIIIVFVSLLLMSCNKTKSLTENEIQTVNNLRSEIKVVSVDISQAEDKDKALTGGLVKSLITARIEILKTTKALIEQRIQAIEAGSPITIATQKTIEDPNVTKELIDQIKSNERGLETAAKELSKYSGGLVLALKQATLATQEQTLAMLKQKYLIAKFGLAYPMIPKPSLPSEPAIKETKSDAQKPGSSNGENQVVLPDSNQLVAGDGPFGLAMGMKVENFGDQIEKVKEGLYKTTNPPIKHPSFEFYALKISKEQGLCWVKGIGKDIPTSSNGSDVRVEFNEMEKKLDQKYGKGERTDFLTSGSLWNESRDWMMGLLKKDRYLMKGWSKKSGAKLPESINEVALMANASNSETGYLSVEYVFENKDACDAEIDKTNDKSL